MAAVSDPGPGPGAQDPYGRLGLAPGASFESVQAAKQQCLEQAGEDPMAKAQVEAAYDAVLMARLRDRQDGQVSQAAASASAREEASLSDAPAAAKPGVGVMQRLRSNLPDPGQSLNGLTPQWTLVEGQGLVVRLIAGGLLLLFLIFSAGSSQLVLSLAVIGSFLSSVRRGRRALPAVGWTMLTLVIGLVVGAIISAVLASSGLNQLPLDAETIQSLPPVLLLWIAALFLV